MKNILFAIIAITTVSCSVKKKDTDLTGAKPVAIFSANQTNITTGSAISFTDLSTNDPTGWSWSFQGGTPSTSLLQNPINIQYNTPGTYNVTLTAKNTYGENSTTKSSYVVVTDLTQQLPILSTNTVSNITNTTAISGGFIIDQGGSSITSKGVCWSTSQNPTILNNKTIDGSGVNSFISNMAGLAINTKYYLRAYATNLLGTAYGNQESFTTTASFSDCGTVTDIDGNIYNTVTIGTQCWMKENLKTTRYNDGNTIPLVTDYEQWGDMALTTNGAYCTYNLDLANNNTYGKLYNWYAVKTGKLAPNGWHVPTAAEWVTLFNYLGGVNIAGGKMKTNDLWSNPNTGASNISGFSAIPAGMRSSSHGEFNSINNTTYFWSSTQYSTYEAKYIRLIYNSSAIENLSLIWTNGFSIRCIKD